MQSTQSVANILHPVPLGCKEYSVGSFGPGGQGWFRAEAKGVHDHDEHHACDRHEDDPSGRKLAAAVQPRAHAEPPAEAAELRDGDLQATEARGQAGEAGRLVRLEPETHRRSVSTMG